jgi:Transposase DDE domain
VPRAEDKEDAENPPGSAGRTDLRSHPEEAGQAELVICDETIERTFAWLGRSRRLSKDYEATTASSEAFVKLTMIHHMTRRLVKKLDS